MATDRSAWSRLEARVIVGVLASLVAVILTSCFGAPMLPEAPAMPPSRPVLADPQPPPTAVDAKRHEIAQAEAKVVILKSELTDLQLAPVRACLRWVEVIAALLIAAGVALAIATRVWGLGIGMRLCIGLAAGGAGLLGACLATDWALGHIAWIIGATAAIVGGLVIWYLRDRAGLAAAARDAWQHVPPEAATSARTDALLDRIDRALTPAKPPTA